MIYSLFRLLNPLDNNEEVAAGYLARIKEQEQTIKTLQAEVAGMCLSRSEKQMLNWIDLQCTISRTSVSLRLFSLSVLSLLTQHAILSPQMYLENLPTPSVQAFKMLYLKSHNPKMKI
jgi:hypothetical protein